MTDLLALLQGFHRDKLNELLRHQSGARFVSQYDHNNTYQYIINREEMQLAWLAAAITELGGTVTDSTELPERGAAGKGDAVAQAIIEEDARAAQAFVERWKPRVEAMTHARHRGMLRVVLGETLEQQRFFAQALEGRTDLLGRRAQQLGPAIGEVLPTRWVE